MAGGSGPVTVEWTNTVKRQRERTQALSGTGPQGGVMLYTFTGLSQGDKVHMPTLLGSVFHSVSQIHSFFGKINLLIIISNLLLNENKVSPFLPYIINTRAHRCTCLCLFPHIECGAGNLFPRQW